MKPAECGEFISRMAEAFPMGVLKDSAAESAAD
jgi:hypothetical protein